MAQYKLDTCGLKCPRPILKIATKAPDLSAGDVLEVVGDCSTFAKDVRAWCERLGKTLLETVNEGGGRIRVKIQF